MLYHYPEKEYSSDFGLAPNINLANELAAPYEDYGIAPCTLLHCVPD